MKTTVRTPQDWRVQEEWAPAADRAQSNAAEKREAERPYSASNSRLLVGRAGIDWILIGTVAGLVLFGLVMVYSSSTKFSAEMEKPVYYFLLRQSLWALLSVVVASVMAFLDYHLLKRLSVLMMLGTLLLLIIVATFGDTTYGAIRSLMEGSIRPSELAKLVTIIYVAV